jgi:hypothetical protein
MDNAVYFAGEPVQTLATYDRLGYVRLLTTSNSQVPSKLGSDYI